MGLYTRSKIIHSVPTSNPSRAFNWHMHNRWREDAQMVLPAMKHVETKKQRNKNRGRKAKGRRGVRERKAS